MRSRHFHLAMLSVLVVTLAACAGGAAKAPTISGAWARAAAVTDKPTAAYLEISNPGNQADALIGASSPAAASVEIHETTTDASGMTGMHPVDRIDVPAGGEVRLEPGGFHLMLMGLDQPLKAGDTIKLDLKFEKAGTITVDAAVREG
jgi:copper(I)-binding protein